MVSETIKTKKMHGCYKLKSHNMENMQDNKRKKIFFTIQSYPPYNEGCPIYIGLRG